MLDDFLAATVGDLRVLRGAIDDQRADDARRSAHRIKGAALTVGARPVARLAQQIEDATIGDREQDWPSLAALAHRLGDALATTAASA